MPGYEEVLQGLLRSGWKPGDPIPEELLSASSDVQVGYPQGIGPSSSFPGEGPPSVSEVGPEEPEAPSVFDNPEAVESILGMGDLRRQMEQAQAMRNAPSPEGRYVSGGRMYVAGSGLEHLVSGIGKYKGTKAAKRIGQEQIEAKKRLIELLRNKKEVETSPVL